MYLGTQKYEVDILNHLPILGIDSHVTCHVTLYNVFFLFLKYKVSIYRWKALDETMIFRIRNKV